ncbi:MAG: hypothetical protein ACHQ4H_01310 [Ktedonobacterales bacterium]
MFARSHRARPVSRPVARAALALAPLLLLLGACGSSGAGGAHTTHAQPTATATPAWQFIWQLNPTSTADALTAAYDASALARDPRGGLHTPAATWWLATGSRFGLVAVQLDPVGRNIAFAVLTRGGPLGPAWIAADSTQLVRPAPGSGPAFAPLPGDDYACSGINAHTTPVFNAMLCLSPAQTYLYGRFALAADRPRDATPVMIAGHSGWLMSANGFASVAVPLADGATYVFGGTAAPEQIPALATKAAAPIITGEL